ncbi:MAG: dephospho-CoA kinase [Paludibacteraceae bacterium]|nr:dephospho-CoA kinase [Paludibacteraceae bacterium]
MIVGITGGIGSGKSTIARALAARGFAVYDCDREAKRIIAENPAVQQQIIALFGEEAFVDGVYNTAYISKCVFSPSLQGRPGEALLAQLNAIIHPAVKEDILSSPLLGGAGGGLLFIESAILFESGLDALCDRIIIVDAPEDIRISRTIARDYHGDATPENINKVRARIRAQQSIIPSFHHSIILINDGSVSISDLADTILHWLQKS